MSLKEQFNKFRAFQRQHLTLQETKNAKLLEAVKANNLPGVEQLIKEGAKVEVTRSFGGESTLGVAVENGFKDIARVLLAAGANPNQEINYHYTTPFLLAAKKGDLELVEMLLDAKANINTVGERGNSALNIAASTSNKPLVDLLLARGAKVDVFNRDGWSALFYTAATGNTDIAEVLLQKGARTDRRDCNDDNVLDVSAARDKGAVHNLIQAHIDAAVPQWQKLDDDRIAHVSIMRNLGYRLTEIFNLKTEQYTTISHNYETGADSTLVRAIDAVQDKKALEEAKAKLGVKPQALGA